MRKIAPLVSAYNGQQLPASLMQRLELTQHLALAVQASRPPGNLRGLRTPRIGVQVIVLAWCLGVVSGGALGAATLVGVHALAGGEWPLAAFGWTAWAKTPAAAVRSPSEPGWETVQVEIDRSGGPRAPLPLEVTGADGAGFEVVMQGLPPGVTPSRGVAVGPSTWVLARTDLDGLSLTLDDSAPTAFDFRIGVSLSPGMVAGGSIVEVRLIGGEQQQRPAPPGGTREVPTSPVQPAKSDEPHVDQAKPPGVSGPAAEERTAGLRRGAQRRAAPVLADGTGVGGPSAEGRWWPEGVFGLGAVPRSPGSSWWQMPPPAWSPFLVGQERP
ncbi:MAG: hypothetical protein J2P50_10010 [Hyphomicrobiaceae bacterium]|nr:hypothetical protein [Hyphomicrobiaceae bacterium]